MASTEKRLGDLHKALAEELIEAIKGREEVTEEEGADGAVKRTKRVVKAAPAVLAVAAKFLKDNAITADIEQNDDLATLKDQLAAKPSKRDLKDAMAAIGQDLLQ